MPFYLCESTGQWYHVSVTNEQENNLLRYLAPLSIGVLAAPIVFFS